MSTPVGQHFAQDPTLRKVTRVVDTHSTFDANWNCTGYVEKETMTFIHKRARNRDGGLGGSSPRREVHPLAVAHPGVLPLAALPPAGGAMKSCILCGCQRDPGGPGIFCKTDKKIISSLKRLASKQHESVYFNRVRNNKDALASMVEAFKLKFPVRLNGRRSCCKTWSFADYRESIVPGSAADAVA